MHKLVILAALALMSTSAEAQVHEIQLGGHTVRIEVPKNCKQISCIQLSAPEKSGKGEKPAGKPRKKPETATTSAPAAAVAATAVPAASQDSPKAPVSQPISPAAPTYSASRTEPQPEIQPEHRKPVARLSPPAEEAKPATVANAGGHEARAEPARTEAPSPVGLWLTEKRDGRIRIEPCGQALCGHVEGKPNEKVLINMKPAQNNRWNGKINDVRSGGTYMSHMSLKGAHALRVEGCAFGGMFCGGETWTRVQ